MPYEIIPFPPGLTPPHSDEAACLSPQMELQQDDQGNYKIPIFRIAFEVADNKRKLLSRFKRELVYKMEEIAKRYQLEPTGIVPLWGEIAKNSADHSQADGFFGLEIAKGEGGRPARLSFVLGDFGMGAYKHIKQYWNESDFFAAYAIAFSKKSTTDLKNYKSAAGSVKNCGIGMSMILDLSRPFKFNLNLFDGPYKIRLSELFGRVNTSVPSAKVIRQHTDDIPLDYGFFYYGECEVALR